MKTNFNYSAWLENRAEKPATKTVTFSDLTKADKIAALLQQLGKSESDYEGIKIVSKETRPWGDLSTPAKLQVMNKLSIKALELLKEGDNVGALKYLKNPSDTELCEVEIKTSFETSTLNGKIDYLLKEFGKPIGTVTVRMPCGQDWVNGLIEYCKSLAVDTEATAEAAKSDKEAAK